MNPRNRNSSSRSKVVPMSSHRQPLPRSKAGRILYYIKSIRNFPLALLGSLLLLVFCFFFLQYLQSSHTFALKVVELHGLNRLKRNQIVGALKEKLNIEEGVSTVWIDCQDVEQLMAGIPEVKEVWVKKQWPNTLVIGFSERRPEGIFVSSTGSFVYDKDGMLFSEALGSDFTSQHLPLVTGFSSILAKSGEALPEEPLGCIAIYKEVFKESAPAISMRISEYHWDRETGLCLVFDEGERFLCGNRLPEETGPVIESFLVDQSTRGYRIDKANLYSDLYVTVSVQ